MKRIRCCWNIRDRRCGAKQLYKPQRNVAVCNSAGESLPDKINGEILVPFSPECELSGVRTVGPEDTLWYVKNFSLPANFNIGRVLLHFGAVDQIATVYLNGTGRFPHRGLYALFH